MLPCARPVLRSVGLFGCPGAQEGHSTLVQAKRSVSLHGGCFGEQKSTAKPGRCLRARPAARYGWCRVRGRHVSSDNHASNSSDQSADVQTLQGSTSNSGHNSADSSVDGANWTDQDANSDATGGNIDGGYDDTSDNTASNTGGDATNDATSDNTGTASASVTSGSSDASNTSDVTRLAGQLVLGDRDQHVGRQLGVDGRRRRVRRLRHRFGEQLGDATRRASRRAC